MRRSVPGTALVVLLSALVIEGCGQSARPAGEISTTKLRSDPRLANGQRAFMQYCNQCHVGGGGGVGPSLNDKWMPSFFIRLKVRHGIGSMPRFSDRVVSDAELDDVVQYVAYQRRNPRDLRH